jgi:hypothetical protein
MEKWTGLEGVAIWARVIVVIVQFGGTFLNFLDKLSEEVALFGSASSAAVAGALGASVIFFIGIWVAFKCARQCSRWAREKKRDRSIAYLFGGLLGLLGLLIYWIFYRTMGSPSPSAPAVKMDKKHQLKWPAMALVILWVLMALLPVETAPMMFTLVGFLISCWGMYLVLWQYLHRKVFHFGSLLLFLFSVFILLLLAAGLVWGAVEEAANLENDLPCIEFCEGYPEAEEYFFDDGLCECQKDGELIQKTVFSQGASS